MKIPASVVDEISLGIRSMRGILTNPDRWNPDNRIPDFQEQVTRMQAKVDRHQAWVDSLTQEDIE